MVDAQSDQHASMPQESSEEVQELEVENQYDPCGVFQGNEDDTSGDEEELEEDVANAFDFLTQLGKRGLPLGQIKYSRGVTYSDRHQRRLKEQDEERKKAANGNMKVTSFFSPEVAKNGPVAPSIPDKALKLEQRAVAIKDLEGLMKSKKRPQGAQWKRHQAVLGLLYVTQNRQPESLREDMALSVAQTLNMGSHFAKRMVSWERSWIEQRVIEEDMRGKNTKIWSLLTDEAVKLTVRAAIDQQKESMFYMPLTLWKKRILILRM